MKAPLHAITGLIFFLAACGTSAVGTDGGAGTGRGGSGNAAGTLGGGGIGGSVKGPADGGGAGAGGTSGSAGSTGSGGTGAGGQAGGGAGRGGAAGSADGGACAASGENCDTAACCLGLTCCIGGPVVMPDASLGPGRCSVGCPVSDRNAKRDFSPVDRDEVLAALTKLPSGAGAATTYTRHRPEGTVLFAALQQHWSTYVADLEASADLSHPALQLGRLRQPP